MRLFIALQFSEEVLDALQDFQEELKACGVEGYFAARENLHLTIAFVGEQGTPDNVLDALEAVPFVPVRLRLDGLGSFSDTYWAGIEESKELAAYAKRLRRGLAERNIPYDRKRFAPHITLVRKAVFHGKTPLPVVEPPQVETEISHVSLMRSDRGKHGMIYTEIGRVLA